MTDTFYLAALFAAVFILGFVAGAYIFKEINKMTRAELDTAIDAVQTETDAVKAHLASIPPEDFTDEITKLNAIAAELAALLPPATPTA